MTLKEKIADLIARGAMQLSRKYRMIGVPPALQEGETYLDKLRAVDPVQWSRLEERARELIVDRDPSAHVTLTDKEFSEWLVQHGCRPLGRPPEPYKSWGELQVSENTLHHAAAGGRHVIIRKDYFEAVEHALAEAGYKVTETVPADFDPQGLHVYFT